MQNKLISTKVNVWPLYSKEGCDTKMFQKGSENCTGEVIGGELSLSDYITKLKEEVNIFSI